MSEMQPPESEQVPTPPLAEQAGETPPAETPAGLPSPPVGASPRVKRKVHGGYFTLGFLTPIAVGGIMVGGAALLSMTNLGGPGAAILGIGGQALGAAVIVGMVVAMVVGTSKGNDRLRSYGLGGLVAYAAAALLSLLVFGACLVTLGGSSLFGGGN